MGLVVDGASKPGEAELADAIAMLAARVLGIESPGVGAMLELTKGQWQQLAVLMIQELGLGSLSPEQAEVLGSPLAIAEHVEGATCIDPEM